ncbi:MAG TPA: hypothetical protein VK694_04545 [Verrucomicrobiae bacterium]|nr:hypothetical protein [Verrucomicrobiae bacterium]
MSVIEIEPFAAGDMEGFGGIDRTEEIELAGFTAGSVAEHAATLARAVLEAVASTKTVRLPGNETPVVYCTQEDGSLVADG